MTIASAYIKRPNFHNQRVESEQPGEVDHGFDVRSSFWEHGSMMSRTQTRSSFTHAASKSDAARKRNSLSILRKTSL